MFFIFYLITKKYQETLLEENKYIEPNNKIFLIKYNDFCKKLIEENKDSKSILKDILLNTKIDIDKNKKHNVKEHTIFLMELLKKNNNLTFDDIFKDYSYIFDNHDNKIIIVIEYLKISSIKKILENNNIKNVIYITNTFANKEILIKEMNNVIN